MKEGRGGGERELDFGFEFLSLENRTQNHKIMVNIVIQVPFFQSLL